MSPSTSAAAKSGSAHQNPDRLHSASRNHEPDGGTDGLAKGELVEEDADDQPDPRADSDPQGRVPPRWPVVSCTVAGHRRLLASVRFAETQPTGNTESVVPVGIRAGLAGRRPPGRRLSRCRSTTKG